MQSFGGSNSQMVGLGDLDGDGLADVFVANRGANQVFLNDLPSFDALAEVALLIDAAEQTIALSGIAPGDGTPRPLLVTASSSNPALIPNPTVSYSSPSTTGSLTFTPVAGQTGTATVSVTITDSGADEDLATTADNKTLTRTFLVSVVPPLSTGLVSYHPFSGNANDATGNGHDGAINGPVLTTDRFGNADAAYDFDGVDDSINLGNSPDLALESFTTSAWLKWESEHPADDYRVVLAKGDSASGYEQNYMLYVGDVAGSVAARVGGGAAAGSDYLFSETRVDDGQWHHVVLTVDSSTGEGALYFDGTLAESKSGMVTPLVDNAAPVMIGVWSVPSYGYGDWDGQIDDVRIYNRAFSAADASVLYQAESSVPNLAPTGVSLTGTTASLAENANTSAATTVATIVITDDGEGTNTITLTGTDAASFEVVGDELRLKAGTALDYETQRPAYSVTVNVEDSSIAGSTSVTVDFALAIDDVNEPPVATSESGFLNANATLTVTAPGVLGNDNDPENDTLTAILVDDVQYGSLSLSADGSFTYTPLNGYFGSDSFTYRADDGTNQSEVTTVSLSISNVIRTFNDPTPTTTDEFGIGVKVTADYVLVGAAADDTHAIDSGQAFLYNAQTGSLLHTFNDPAIAASSNFGHALDIDGDNVLIASTRDDSLGTDVGRVYLFDAVSGNLLHTFDDPTVTASDEFGWSVAIEGNHVIVGAHFDDTHGTNVGQVHLFDAVTGNLVRTFDDPSVSGEDKFGWSVDIEDDWLLVGSSEDNDEGATGRDSEAYLFDINTGTHLRTFIDPTHTTSDGFGEKVVLSGNHVFVSDHGDDTGGDGVGQIHQFDASTGNLVRTYDNPNPDASDYFGGQIAVEGNYVIVGSTMDDLPATTNAGQAYLFDIATGDLLQTLSDPTPTEAGYFGASVAIYSNHAVVGAHHDNLQGAGVGQVHVFSLGPNEAPTGVSLTNTTTSLAEDANTTGATKVADIVITDDALGSNVISLSGTDAASFEVVGTELFLAAGTALDFETKSQLQRHGERARTAV